MGTQRVSVSPTAGERRDPNVLRELRRCLQTMVIGQLLSVISARMVEREGVITSAAEFLEWADQRDWLPTVAPVSEKIPVGREDDGVAFDFRHSHETSIGE